MKIHGTAKGGALATKDFGVAFGGIPVVSCELAATDFDVLSNWTQDPVGTVTWSEESWAPNYARNSTLITGSNWEFTFNPENSNLGNGLIGRAGVGLTTTPTDPEYFNFDWLPYNGGAGALMYFHYSLPEGGSTVQLSTGVYESGAIYTIKCVDSVVTFSKSGAGAVNLPHTVPEAYYFDSSVNTSAYFSVSTTSAGLADMVCICESYANCTP